jgi:hypothetical protein
MTRKSEDNLKADKMIHGTRPTEGREKEKKERVNGFYALRFAKNALRQKFPIEESKMP